MREIVDIVESTRAVDASGFATHTDTVIATIRAAKEDRHGAEKWANLATFSEATTIFRFRKIPGLTLTTAHAIVCAGERYRILSIDDVQNRSMYYEILTNFIQPSAR